MPLLFVLLVAAAGAADVPTKLPEPPLAGRQHYQEHCWACHGKRALGDGPSRTVFGTEAPPLAGLDSAERPRAHAVILRGKGAMPAYGAVLAPDEIDTILVWLGDLDPQTGDDPHREVKNKGKKKASGKPTEADAPEAGEVKGGPKGLQEAPAPVDRTVTPPEAAAAPDRAPSDDLSPPGEDS